MAEVVNELLITTPSVPQANNPVVVNTIPCIPVPKPATELDPRCALRIVPVKAGKFVEFKSVGASNSVVPLFELVSPQTL